MKKRIPKSPEHRPSTSHVPTETLVEERPTPLHRPTTTRVEERPASSLHGPTTTQVEERPALPLQRPSAEERPALPSSPLTPPTLVRDRSLSATQRLTKRPDAVERPTVINTPHMWGRGAIVSALKDRAAQQERRNLLTGLHDIISLGGLFDLTNSTTVFGSVPLKLTDGGLQLGDLQWAPEIKDNLNGHIVARQTAIRQIKTLADDIRRTTQPLSDAQSRIKTLSGQIEAITGQKIAIAGTTDQLKGDIQKLERQIPQLMKQLTTLRRLSSLQGKVVDPLKAQVLQILSDSGQLEMLRQHATEGFDYDVSIDYFHLRSLAAVGFHKDTLGQTLFIHLAFSNEKPILGTEWIVDMGPGGLNEPAALWPHESKLPDWFKRDLLEARTRWKQFASENGPKSDAFRIWGETLAPFGSVSFNDPLIIHTTPDTTSRKAADNKLSQQQGFVEESTGGRVSYPLPTPSMAARPRSHSDAQAFASQLPADTKNTPRSFIRLEVRAKPQAQKTQ